MNHYVTMVWSELAMDTMNMVWY